MPERPAEEEVSLRYRLEWLLVRFAFWLFRALGRRRSSALGGWLARKVGPRLSAHKTAERNMARALPEIDAAERAVLLDRMWDNLGRNIGELPFIGQLDFASPDVELVGANYLDEYARSGKAAFFVSAHFGPWEMCPSVGKHCQVPITIVYRAANNPLVDRFFQDQRHDPYSTFVPKGKTGALAIMRAVQKKGAIALLNDQKLNQGLPIPFFGRDVMTAPAIGELACRYSLPIYPVKAERLPEGRFRVTVSAPLDLPDTGDRQQDVIETLTRINEMYEDWIREKPDHWFWVHNRWSD
ncbi:lysophospholipid acyltransferase family protein [Sneathiella chinensis]|uniref:Lipid A biosynthesis lauroyl acyltransferase n=1 Tax=Sneathiella chinensis TaxID=349750 RepID=A0ABQ5U8I5_9PROT|nr:lauroyl acyltransferase [Sneathiella chinensis]GLQ07716.1 lipid A biosynthesis lauroyl acyltransferase [Sneathiella chinensis]